MNFREHLCAHGEKVALVKNEVEVTYGELLARADRLATKLGRGPQLVALFCSNQVDSVVGYLASLLHGHTALLLEGSPSSQMNQAMLAHFEVSYIYAGDTDIAYQLHATGVHPPKLHPDLRLLLSTSGSTGSKKLVKLSESNLLSNALSISQYLRIDTSERPITTLPMNYSYGLSVVNSHLVAGAAIVLNSHPVSSREFWTVFNKYQVTSFAGVPFIYQMLQRLRFDRLSLPTLRYFTQAGGKLAPEAVKYFADVAERTNKRFYVMYGQTEATARISYLPAESVKEKPASIGLPIPGGVLSLQSEDGKPVRLPNCPGELVFRGGNVMMGYATTPEDLSVGDELQGVLLTGDIAVKDEDGFFYIVGRKRRFIKITGNRIGLDEVEAFLNSRGYSSAVIGIDEMLNVLLEGNGCDEIPQLLWDAFSIHPRNTSVLTCTAIPRNPSGKVIYPAIAAIFGLE